MELAFNEISQTPLLDDKHQANARMLLFSKAVAEARKKGFKNIRIRYSAAEINLTQEYSLHNWLFDKDFPLESRSLFYDMFVQPFLKEGDDEIEKKFIDANFFFEDAENKIPKQKCMGLSSAYLSETLAISFQSSPAWQKNKLAIVIEKGADILTGEIHHVFSKECFNQDSITDFVESITTLELVETNINPNDKNFHFTAHHGKQELTALWNRIKNSPFVIKGMSIEWGGNSFYKKPQRDGKLDIVDLRSDKRYAMQVQTTGRNYRETEAIAKILKEEYDR